MKCSWLILVILTTGSILLTQVGCQEAQKSVERGEEPVVGVDKSATAPDKPGPAKPAPDTGTVKTAPDKPVPASARRPRRIPPRLEPVTAKLDPNAPSAKIRFQKLVHDFGDIEPSSRSLCEFGFKNVGDAQLKILSVNCSCGCTSYTLEKKEYAPGESGTIKIKYSAASRPGPVNRHCTVTSNDPTTPQVSLTMKGRIVERVGFEPKRLNLLLKKEAALPKVTLTSLDGKPFGIKDVKSSVNAIGAEFDPSVEATKLVVQLTANKDQLRRVTNGVVEISLTHPSCKSVTIPFSALARFKVNPPVIILFDAEPGKAVVRKNVSILNNYKEDFEIESAKSKEGITKVLEQQRITSGYNFTLEITPPNSGEARRFSDEFSVQVKDGDLLTIRVQGFYARKKTGANAP